MTRDELIRYLMNVYANGTDELPLVRHGSFYFCPVGGVAGSTSREAADTQHRCPGCQTLEGDLHFIGCELERCGDCGGPRAWCPCVKDNAWFLQTERVPYLHWPRQCARCGILCTEMCHTYDAEFMRLYGLAKEMRGKTLCDPCYLAIQTWVLFGRDPCRRKPVY